MDIVRLLLERKADPNATVVSAKQALAALMTTGNAILHERAAIFVASLLHVHERCPVPAVQ